MSNRNVNISIPCLLCLAPTVDVEHDLADGASVGHKPERGGDVVEAEGGTDVRRDPMRCEQLQQLVLVATQLVRLVLGETPELEAQDADALQQHEVERDPAVRSGRLAAGHEPAAPAE